MSDTILSLTVERDQLLAMLDKYEDIEAERDRLREALVSINTDMRTPPWIRRIASDALASTASPEDQIGQSVSWSAREP